MQSLPTEYFAIVQANEKHPPIITFKGHQIELYNVLSRYKNGMDVDDLSQW